MRQADRLRALLREGELDALLLTSDTCRLYASGFPCSSGAAVLTREGDYLITDFRYIEAAEQKAEGFTVRMCGKDNPLRKTAAAILSAHGCKRVGYEADTLSVREYELWLREIPAVFVPAQEAIAALRAVKTPAELAAIAAAQRVAESALDDVLLHFVRCGVSEKAVAGELIAALYRAGADGPAFAPIVASGPNGALPHAEPSDRLIAKGDLLTLDFGALLCGYRSDMTRTYAMGAVSDGQREVYALVLQAQQAGIAAVRAGVPGSEPDARARAVIESAGYGECFGHGFGHGVGLEVHETPNCNPTASEPLPAGAVITAEPGIYIKSRFGARIEDMLAVTPGGCE
ncbi:MAG: aminopeptidase P family protein, partial [Oscillospiraceae bacterium]|nr:aminopeptidase P family protein [Oscillospiraceae bacterium]